MRVSAAILAGGRARRLGGGAKGLLEVGGRRIVDREVEALLPLVDEVLLVTGDEAYAGVAGIRRVRDRQPGRGPLAGLDAAFAACDAEALLVFACDLPFLDRRLAQAVRDEAPEAEAVVPLVGGRAQPLHARFSRAAAAPVARRLEQGKLRLLDLLEDLAVVYLHEQRLAGWAPSLDGLVSVNTPEELERARASLG